MHIPPHLPMPHFPGHHSEPGDPALLDWIRHLLDSLTGLGPMAFVFIFGAVVIAIPICILAAFLTQRIKHGSRT